MGNHPGKITETRRGGPVRKVFIVDNTLYIPRAIDLKTGIEKRVTENPVSGETSRFELSGQNFCGTIAASRHIIARRSTSLGFSSLTEDAPCYWLPENQTSCWLGLLPAGGLLLSPEMSGSCVCSFNYKTSLAMIPVIDSPGQVPANGGEMLKPTGPNCIITSMSDVRDGRVNCDHGKCCLS